MTHVPTSDTSAGDAPAAGAGASRPLSDERLAERAATGDEHALAAIYDRYHQDLYRFCLAIVRNPQDAQDALQNAMVKVLRALPGETRRIQLKPWLYRIAHNEAVELLRRRRDSVAIEPELAAAGAEPADAVAARERLRRLLADLGELPERQRAALVMRELGGLGFDEIGAAFDTSDAVARQTLYEARLSLRQMEAGREMSCQQVTWELSEADGRVARRREIQAHLRSCPQCRAFRDEIAGRRHDFAAIAPLPLAASAALLKGLLGAGVASAATGAGAAGAGAGAGAAGAGAGAAAAGGAGAAAAGAGLGGAAAAGAGSALAGSAVLKAAATVAVVAAGVTAADRGGLVETPLPSSVGGAKSSGPTPGGPAPGAPGADREATGADETGPATRAERRRERAAKRRAKRAKAARAARARERRSGKEPGATSGGEGAAGRAGGGGQGRPDGLPATSGAGKGGGSSRGKSKGGSKRGGRAKARPPRRSRPSRSRGGGRSGGRTAPAPKTRAPKKPTAPTAPATQRPADSSTDAGAAPEGASPEG